jgi:hypothetical protein
MIIEWFDLTEELLGLFSILLSLLDTDRYFFDFLSIYLTKKNTIATINDKSNSCIVPAFAGACKKLK